MTLREMVLSIDFEEWVEKKSFELFGERSEYIRSLFFPIYKTLTALASTCRKNASGRVDVADDGIYVLFRVNDVPVESLLDVECEESDFDLVMWELARSGRKWKY